MTDHATDDSNPEGSAPGADTGGAGLDRPHDAPELYAQDGQGFGAIVYAHYFTASSDWLVTEYDPDEDVVFGWACLNGDRQNAELGYTSLAELDSVRFPVLIQVDGDVKKIGEVGVERDTGWPAGLALQAAIDLLDQRQGR